MVSSWWSKLLRLPWCVPPLAPQLFRILRLASPCLASTATMATPAMTTTTTTAVGAFSLDWKDKCPGSARHGLPSSYAASDMANTHTHTHARTQVTLADKRARTSARLASPRLDSAVVATLVAWRTEEAAADALKQSKLRTTICKS